MAASQAVSFDAIIQADRKKRKNEELASKILGKNRKTVAAGAGAGIKAQKTKPGSLASRIGVVKPSASATSKSTKNHRTQPAPVLAADSQPKRASKRRPDEERLLSALNPANGQSTVRDNPVGITIRGAGSGSFVVIGSNFAPGTTAADIQSAIEPLSGQILSCWITSQHPTVTAEITYADKWAAEKAIANFHNQRADGRILSMRFKHITPEPTPSQHVQNHQSSFSNLREQADRERRLNRKAEPTVQDGRQWSTPLAKTLANAIKVTGPIPIAAFMRQVLTSPEGGYYTTRPEGGGEVFGKKGDFVTSPEISQVFGELVGIWTITEWMAQGSKHSGVQLIEVGPGKGTLMDDMLRTFRNFKSFASSLEAIYLVEASPTLREVQKQRLCGDAAMEETDIGHKSISKYFNVPVLWVEDIRLLPHEEDKTPFIFAHEFFDALPIHAFESIPPAPENSPEQKEIITPTGPAKLHQPMKPANTPQWREIMVTLNPKAVEDNIEGEPEFKLTLAKASTPSSLVIPEISERYRKLKSTPGSTIEVSPESRIYASDFARRIGGSSQPPRTVGSRNSPAAQPKKIPSGAALIMDYGTMSTIPINSLRGIQHHRTVPALSSPGQVDVSADVDFMALAEAAIEASEGVEVHGPVEQGDFLQVMGIAERMQQLLRGVQDEEKRKTLESGWKRLIERGGGGMGKIYKFMAIIPENGGRRRPVGFGGTVQM
ncbi:hypothetical protein CNMCM8812_000913 [Aspergillus fumigatus]|nr:hypothetical protein CNMCM8714_001204 [Aspergillus fumigatus]KAF4270813.1 hypothetical protein CNMCM8812_000913 [Aspergillus fumigatus]KAH1456196.1 hypothetical protein KXX13_000467 [Aspergillus fumigatus]KAH1536546.1 hypothetical protein KXX18_003375 [Aspergillus fumigatus]KAH1604909.1 hypothetical protein KXX44_002194 [Aspergillus fumigatus]